MFFEVARHNIMNRKRDMVFRTLVSGQVILRDGMSVTFGGILCLRRPTVVARSLQRFTERTSDWSYFFNKSKDTETTLWRLVGQVCRKHDEMYRKQLLILNG